MNRKYPKYSDYLTNVVDKCSHEWLIMSSIDFRMHRIDKFNEVPTELPSGVLMKIIPARCKSYSCEICGRKKVYDLVDRLKSVDFKGYRFFTLTLRNEYSEENTEKNIKRISDCFNKLNKKLRKMPEFKGLEYFRVVEVGHDGMVHIHGIWNRYVPVKKLSQWWFEITGDSFITKPERIKCHKDVINYLFKYLTKNIRPKMVDTYQNDFFGLNLIDSAKIFYENGKRRFSASRNFFPKQVKKKAQFLPDYFETSDCEEIEKIIVHEVRDFGLKRDNFDFSMYDESDQFLDFLFDSS